MNCAKKLIGPAEVDGKSDIPKPGKLAFSLYLNFLD